MARAKTDVPAGSRFGRWTVLGEGNPKLDSRGKPRSYDLCRCDCGTEREVRRDGLLKGQSISCGCHQREVTGKIRLTHGGATTALYRRRSAMLSRCTQPSHKMHHRYGGRGISVCEAWQNDFAAFRDWALANGFREDLELDRIDNDGNYTPENCRWVTRAENLRNKEAAWKITAFGETKCASEWAKDSRCRVGPMALAVRLRNGWDAEIAITRPRWQRINE